MAFASANSNQGRGVLDLGWLGVMVLEAAASFVGLSMVSLAGSGISIT